MRKKLKALLLDIDGTVVFQGEAIPGAADALRYVRDQGLTLRFLTNITGRTQREIADDLQSQGLQVAPEEIQTATTACIEYLKSRPSLKCHLLVPDNILPMFEGIIVDNDEPDAVVISDIGAGFTFDVLNRAFLMLRAGADLIALQKNLFWFDREGAKLDCGAFLLGLEAASGKSALVTGKPSSMFFEQALQSARCQADEVLIIGDDVKTDIVGARNIGATSVLLGTGKFEAQQLDAAGHDHFLSSIAELPSLLRTSYI
jgi:HAD superfamily hydrolase (TIGR01458 family)